MKELILLFRLPDPAQRLAIERALFPLQVRIIFVKKEEYLKPLKVLVGLEEERDWSVPYTGKELSDPMVVFAFFTEERLRQALVALKDPAVPLLPYKAILTKTNQQWNPIACFEELKKEHAQFQK